MAGALDVSGGDLKEICTRNQSGGLETAAEIDAMGVNGVVQRGHAGQEQPQGSCMSCLQMLIRRPHTHPHLARAQNQPRWAEHPNWDSLGLESATLQGGLGAPGAGAPQAPGVLLGCGSHNHVPRLRGSSSRPRFLSSGVLEAKDQGVGRVGSFSSLSPWLADGHPLPVASRVFPLCPCSDLLIF